MRILLLSDIHTEFHRDRGWSFVDGLNTDVDVLVVAGDFCAYYDLDGMLRLLAEKFSQVVYVWGNHECWDTEIQKVREEAHYCAGGLDNLHVLDNTTATIDGQRFIGGTLWFRDEDGLNAVNKGLTQDFSRIEKLDETVAGESARTVDFLEKETCEDDIIVTHYLPSYRSVHERFAGFDNRFFVCDMESLIARVQPKMWLHGHTHTSVDCNLGETRVICNPFGYAGVELNPEFDDGKIIEVPPASASGK